MKLLFLALFLSTSAFSQSQFPDNFIFGVANAPAQIEDNLQDIWLEWAQQGHVAGWNKSKQPNERLQFWTKPETEIEYAYQLGAKSFRMGIDWGRVMPGPNQFDQAALKRYREIIELVKKKKMKVMLTLWHHSVPKWFQEKGGWKNPENKKYFYLFAQKIITSFQRDVEWWVTFNEANVFVTMAYGVGIWPPGEKNSPLALFAWGPYRGDAIKALDLMAETHNDIYDWAHERYPSIKMGLAHNMAYYNGKSYLDRIKAYFADEIMNWRFPEIVGKKMDFYGFNYYGAEWLKGTQVDIDPEEEYSEAGRAIYVEGLYKLLKEIHKRFPESPVIITENGIADATDIIRPSYHIEHLMAVQQAIKEGVPVEGYYVWSLTDNLEWADGYCPKFGLIDVDRETMERIPRPSYGLFQMIIRENKLTPKMRDEAWQSVLANQGKERPFCRADDGITSFPEPKSRKFVKKDWRFHPQ